VDFDSTFSSAQLRSSEWAVDLGVRPRAHTYTVHDIERVNDVRQRPWKSAARGFLVSEIPVIAMLLWLYLSAETVAVQAAPQEAEFRQAIISGTQSAAIKTGLVVTAAVGVYWALAGFLGRSNLHRFSSANCIMTLAFAVYLVVAANGLYGWVDTYCDQLPFPHSGFQITKVGECPSSSSFFQMLLIISLVLLLLSLIVRVAVSHVRRAPS